MLSEVINTFLLNIKKNKQYELHCSYIGLNLGCGADNPPHWLGIDGGISILLLRILPQNVSRRFFKYFNMSHVYHFEEYYQKIKISKIVHHDLCHGIPFKDDSIPSIYSSHVIEHLTKHEAETLLKDCYRVLKPRGIIRLCVPSLDSQVRAIKDAIKKYEEGNNDSIQNIVANTNYGYIGKFAVHRCLYNFAAIQKLLSAANFKDVKEWTFKNGKIPEVELLDTREGLYIEAIKS